MAGEWRPHEAEWDWHVQIALESPGSAWPLEHWEHLNVLRRCQPNRTREDVSASCCSFLKFLCTSMVPDKWELGLSLGHFLPSLPISDVLHPRQTATARLSQAPLKACASVLVPCCISPFGMPSLPCAFLQSVPQGHFLGNPILIPWSKYGSSLYCMDSSRVSPRPWFPYGQSLCSLPTLHFAPCLVQSTLTRRANKREAQVTRGWSNRKWKSLCFLGWCRPSTWNYTGFVRFGRKRHWRKICLFKGP